MIARARVVADQKGIEAHEVPLKFLVPFLEKASLEQENSELTHAWANLLVAAADEYDVVYQAYSNVLSQLGPAEVGIVKEFFEAGGLGPNKEEVALDTTSMRRVLHGIMGDYFSLDEEKRFDSAHKVSEDLASTLTRHYGAFIRIELVYADNKIFLRSNDAMMAKNSSIFLLDNLGLVHFQNTAYEAALWDGGLMPQGVIGWIQITEFGLQFVKTCRGSSKESSKSNLPEIGGEFVRRAEHPPEKTFEVSDDMSTDDVLKKLVSK